MLFLASELYQRIVTTKKLERVILNLFLNSFIPQTQTEARSSLGMEGPGPHPGKTAGCLGLSTGQREMGQISAL